LLFINPHSRNGRDWKQLAINYLASDGIEVVDASDLAPSSLPEIIRSRSSDVDRVIVGGGDGTVNRLLEVLLKIDLPVGILPLGTANDLAATLHIPASLEDACKVAASGSVRRIDLGWVNGKHFVNEGSLGLSNHIVRNLDPTLKKRFGILAIAVNAARVMRRARRFRAQLRCDDKTYDVRTLQVTVGNGERFGGFIKTCDADISDHRLDLYSLEFSGIGEFVKLIPALVRGHYQDISGVRLEHGCEIEVQTSRPRPIYTDGELATTTPALFRLVPSALAVFTPSRPVA
jgi:YegS/Rv2252/BmrU family lipid kinase